MKTIEINQKSWHYKLAEMSCRYPDCHCRDICQYTRHVLWGLVGVTFLILLVVGTGSFFMWLFGGMIAWFAAMIVSMSFIDPNPQTVALLISLAICAFTALVFSIPKAYNAISRRIDVPFAKTAYDSWKNKWCAKIEFK